jgi:hypothetical protein
VQKTVVATAFARFCRLALFRAFLLEGINSDENDKKLING